MKTRNLVIKNSLSNSIFPVNHGFRAFRGKPGNHAFHGKHGFHGKTKNHNKYDNPQSDSCHARHTMIGQVAV